MKVVNDRASVADVHAAQFVADVAAYLAIHLHDRIIHLSDDRLADRVKIGIRRAYDAGARAASAIQLFVTLMFALEPEFDERTRVREHFRKTEGSFDERLTALLSESYPNCWYTVENDYTEKRWNSLSDRCVGSAVVVSGSISADPLPSQLAPTYGFQLDVPLVRTPDSTVRSMLELAEVRSADLVVDLGCGDGRLVIAAAKEFGARAIGVDLNPDNVKAALDAVSRAGVSHLVSVWRRDLLDMDLTDATVVTLYLLHSVNLMIRDRLRKQLKPGSRIVSRSFDMGDWIPDVEIGRDPEKLFLWRI